MPPIALRTNSTLSEVVAALNAFRELIGGEAQLRTHTVAVRHGGEWRNHATSITLERGEPPAQPPSLVEFRDVALVATAAQLDGNLTVDALRDYATRWRTLLGTPQSFEFQDPVHVDREGSRPGTAPYPRWTCRLHERVIGANTYSLPSGPVLAHARGIFAPDVPSLTADWLGESFWTSRTTVAYEYWLRIEDRRARIIGLSAQDDRLAVTLDGITREPLYCGASVKTFAGTERRYVEPVVDSKVVFRFDGSIQELSLWVMLQDGQPLDSYDESPHRASWGAERAIYNRPRSLDTEPETQLDAALASGEAQSVEFKPYIRLSPREPKADELLETVCAFANAAGGTMFVGVSDHAEPVGIEVDLRRAYGERCSADPDCLRDAYVNDLKRLFNEGLVPAVIPEFKWHELAHRWVLATVVPASDVFVSLIATGELYRRVGATNRKLRPADVLRESTES